LFELKLQDRKLVQRIINKSNIDKQFVVTKLKFGHEYNLPEDTAKARRTQAILAFMAVLKGIEEN
jgi:hypothetical protein